MSQNVPVRFRSTDQHQLSRERWLLTGHACLPSNRLGTWTRKDRCSSWISLYLERSTEHLMSSLSPLIAFRNHKLDWSSGWQCSVGPTIIKRCSNTHRRPSRLTNSSAILASLDRNAFNFCRMIWLSPAQAVARGPRTCCLSLNSPARE
jgi:hypothetical protein